MLQEFNNAVPKSMFEAENGHSVVTSCKLIGLNLELVTVPFLYSS